MTTKPHFSVTIIFLLILISPAAYACSCATGNPPFEFNRAKAVFVGRMLGGTEKLTGKEDNGKPYAIEAGAVRFRVEETFKGDVAEVTTAQIDSMKGTSCGPYGLKRGGRYLVYGYAGKDDDNTLYTGVCTRTGEMGSSYVKEDLNFLRNLPPPGTDGHLRGRIWADLRAGGATPLPNVKISIQGQGGTVLTVLSDERGEFTAHFLKPGKYRVQPEFPENYYSEHEFEEVTVEDRGTAAVGFEAYIKGTVLGRVVDADGRPFNSMFLHFVGGNKRLYGHSTGESGAFHVDGVPPGEYVLYVELQNKDYNKNRNLYYPGTLNRDEATVITVGLGAKVEGLQFVLPDAYKVRSIGGRVLWKDGTPAAGVEVMLLCPKGSDEFAIEFGPTTTTTDDLGNFQLEGLANEAYRLEARGNRERKKDEFVALHSPDRQIVLREDLKNIELVLSENGLFGSGCPE
jgi:hypothetical protein